MGGAAIASPAGSDSMASSWRAKASKRVNRWWPQRDSNPCLVAFTFSPAESHPSPQHPSRKADTTKTRRMEVPQNWAALNSALAGDLGLRALKRTGRVQEKARVQPTSG